MTESCCNHPTFIRNVDPAIADIGNTSGAEFTIGTCASCQHSLIDVFVSTTGESAIIPVESDFVTALIAAPKTTSPKEILREWWESR